MVVAVFHVAADHLRREHVAKRGILPAGNEHRKILFGGGHHPAVFGIDLVKLLQLSRQQNLEKKFVRKKSLRGFVRGVPILHDRALDAAHGFFFGDARVGDAIQVMFEQFDFLRGREVAVMRHALVMIVGDEIVNVLFQIGAGAADSVNFVLADHLGERKAQLRRAHRARERDEHLAAAREMLHVGFRGVDHHGRVEMAIVMLHEGRDGTSRPCLQARSWNLLGPEFEIENTRNG